MSELIIGLHSIAHALKNKKRILKHLYLNEDGKNELQNKYQLKAKEFPSTVMKNHHFQDKAKELFQGNDQKFSRIPTGALLEVEPLEEYDANWLYKKLNTDKNLKLLCLDQITDVHNGGAIFRTAAFYGVDIILLPEKGSFGLTPGFFRISSGAREHIQIARVSSFPKTVAKLQEKGVEVIAFDEHAEKALDEINEMSLHRLLIFGTEETGISHALMRVAENKLRIVPKGEILSLNVSVAAALGMEKAF